jgi:acyl-CoA thioester hydrolase
MELNELLSSYKHKLKIQIRFKDIDKLGHVNNANHLTYFETGRVEYFKDVFKNSIDWVNTGMILANVEITYKRPILLEDNLFCYTKITRFGTKSFDVENLLISETNGNQQLCAYGKNTLVCINYSTKQTIEVPIEWVNAVKLFEK